MQKKTTSESLAEEQIAVRAFERWMGRGCPITDGAEDWFAARNELEAELSASAARRASARKPAGKSVRALA